MYNSKVMHIKMNCVVQFWNLFAKFRENAIEILGCKFAEILHDLRAARGLSTVLRVSHRIPALCLIVIYF